MEHQQENNSSLQLRVDAYLRGKPKEYAEEASEEDAAEVVFEMLQRAEADLASAQERVDHLKWELTKVKSHCV